MDIDTIVKKVRVDGWCVIPQVIPTNEVNSICSDVAEEVEKADQEHRAFVVEMEAKGHKVSGHGIGSATGLISLLPALHPYLSNESILGAAEAILGPFVRISTVSGLVNNPGVKRGYWHSDWPFNQTVAAKVPAPYPDVVMHLSSIFMLTEFSEKTGGTLIVPGSHRFPNNPSGSNGEDAMAPYPNEMNSTGKPGDVLFYDSRLWHAVPDNPSSIPRVAISIRYAPWWLNLNAQKAGHPDHQMIVVDTNGKGNINPILPAAIYDSLPNRAQLLFQHWLS